MSHAAPAHSTREIIINLLGDLPPESLKLVEQFVRSLKSQPPGAGQPRYPTIGVPAESLALWETLLTEGYDGDALADTESAYDD